LRIKLANKDNRKIGDVIRAFDEVYEEKDEKWQSKKTEKSIKFSKLWG